MRCHDDIGWAITEEDAAAVGEDGFLHRRFLADFYAGDFPGSFARGARFQSNPRTGEARTSGTAASLGGLEQALASGDAVAVDLAMRRMLLLHAIAFAHGGLPLVYMGDELGLRNDPAWADDPAHRDDNRWMHRPPMDWEAAERRHDPATVEGRLWAGLRRLIAARRATRAVHAQGAGEPFWTGNDHVFGARARARRPAADRARELHARAPGGPPRRRCTAAASHLDAGGRRARRARPARRGRAPRLEPYQFAWLDD